MKMVLFLMLMLLLLLLRLMEVLFLMLPISFTVNDSACVVTGNSAAAAARLLVDTL